MRPSAEVRADAIAQLLDLAYGDGHTYNPAVVAGRRDALTLTHRRAAARAHRDGDPAARQHADDLYRIATTTEGLLDAVLHGIPDGQLPDPADTPTITDLEEALRGW